MLLFFFSPLQDLLNFDDPLNVAAAEHYERDKVSTITTALSWDLLHHFIVPGFFCCQSERVCTALCQEVKPDVVHRTLYYSMAIIIMIIIIIIIILNQPFPPEPICIQNNLLLYLVVRCEKNDLSRWIFVFYLLYFDQCTEYNTYFFFNEPKIK